MKLVISIVLLTAIWAGLTSAAKKRETGQKMKDLVSKLNKLQIAAGGKKTNLGRILTHVEQTLGQASDAQSLFIAGDNGKVYSGGLLGNLIGALLGTVGYILGGDNGLCGGAHGLYMQQHQGLLGGLLDLLQPLTGSLGNGGGPDADKGLVNNLLKSLGLDHLLGL